MSLAPKAEFTGEGREMTAAELLEALAWAQPDSVPVVTTSLRGRVKKIVIVQAAEPKTWPGGAG